MNCLIRVFHRLGAPRGALVACVLLTLCSLLATAHDLERMARSMAQRFGQEGTRNLQDWRSMLGEAARAQETEQLRRVNDFFNRRIRFGEDPDIWQATDYWATPLETLGRAAGDCEDFALAKYFSLVEIGVPAERLRLIYVRARIGGPNSSITQAHMVLGWYANPEAEPLVLDNLLGEIRPASRRPDLAPVFSFNSQGVWMAGADRPASPVDRLSRWNELILRMRGEGFTP